MSDILLASAQGYGNIGDDAIRDAIATELSTSIPGINIVVTHPEPDQDLVLDSKMVIVGGGGLLYDSVPTNVEYYTAYLEMAQRHRIPNALFNVEVQGNIITEYGASRYSSILNRVDYLSVRNWKSVHILRSIGVRTPIHVSSDVSFLLRPVKRTLHTDKPVIGVSLSIPPENNVFDTGIPSRSVVDDSSNVAYMTNIVKSLEHYRSDFNFVVLPFGAEERGEVSRHFADILGCRVIDYNVTPSEILGMVGDMSLMITSRLHPLILSMVAGTPCGVVTKGGKVLDLLHTIGYPQSLIINGKNTDRVVERRDTIKNIMTKNLPYLVDLAKDDSNRLVALTKHVLESNRLRRGR